VIRITIEGPPTEGKTHIKHTIVTALRRAGFEDVVVEGDPVDRSIEGRIRGVLQARQLEITLVERITKPSRCKFTSPPRLGNRTSESWMICGTPTASKSVDYCEKQLNEGK
jgi:hypothetical protein